MTNNSHPSPSDSHGATTADEIGMTALLAHSMLGTVAAIRGALDMTITDELAAPDREVLLSMAIARLEILAEQLRDLAAGAPPTLVPVADARVLGWLDIEDGTQVELFNAFNGTWANGFEIAGKTAGGYRVRRRSDGSLLPGYTSRSDLRPVQGRNEFQR